MRNVDVLRSSIKVSSHSSSANKNGSILCEDIGDSHGPAGLRKSWDADEGSVWLSEEFFDITNVKLSDLIVQVERELARFNEFTGISEI